jgi:transposase
MVDNLKSAVLQRLAGVAPVFNPRYYDFARHYGFTIAPCNVARSNEKGRMESGVGYVKKNFLRGLELSEFSAIQAAAQVWLDTIANVRSTVRRIGARNDRELCGAPSPQDGPVSLQTYRGGQMNQGCRTAGGIVVRC